MAELLNSNDIKHLIHDYEAQIRRLQFELDQAKLTMRTLKDTLSSALEREKGEAEATLAAVREAQQASLEQAGASKDSGRKKSKRSGRPRKAKSDGAQSTGATKATKKTKKKSPKKSGGRRAYRLSEYDQYLMDCLRERGTATITSEFVDYIMAQKQAAGEAPKEDEVSTMVARSLQKLSNRRDDLAKVAYEGRGKAYALPEWMRAGKLKAKHSRS